jgi:hypothetical protein
MNVTEPAIEQTAKQNKITPPLGRLLRQPSFVICVVLLVVCACGLQYTAAKLKIHFRKLPLPLKNALDDLDVSKLVPYEFVHATKIQKEIEDELGTTNYIQWILKDGSREKTDPLSLISLFITYYTGNPDKVPHTPDTCYAGSGGRVDSTKNITLHLPNSAADKDEVPFRLLDISLPRQWTDFEHRLVGYFFAVNGTYRCERRGVQMVQSNPFHEYAYFAKIEVYFPLAGTVEPDDVVAAMERFLQVLTPVVVSDHLPDWEPSGEGDNK